MKPPTFQELTDLAVWLGSEAERKDIIAKDLEGSPATIAAAHMRATARRYARWADIVDHVSRSGAYRVAGVVGPVPLRAKQEGRE